MPSRPGSALQTEADPKEHEAARQPAGAGSGNSAARLGCSAAGEWDFPRRHPRKSPQLCPIATGDCGASQLLPASQQRGSASSCGRQLHEPLLLPPALGTRGAEGYGLARAIRSHIPRARPPPLPTAPQLGRPSPSLGSNRGGGECGTAESARGSPCSWTRRRFAQEHALVGSSRCTLRPAASISSRSTEQFRSGLGAKSCQAGRMEGRGGGWRQHVEPGGTWPRTRLPADRGAAREPRGLRDATPGELRGAARRARGPGHRRHAGRPHGTR